MKKTLSILAVSSLITALSVLTIAISMVSGGGVSVSAGNSGSDSGAAATKQTRETKKATTKEAISKKFDNGMTLGKALKKDKPVAILFYADWCGFCKRFAPLYSTLSKDKELKKQFTFAYVNSEDEANRAYFQEYQIKGFPSLFLYNPKTGDKVQVPNSLMFQSDSENTLKQKFQAFLEEGASAITPPEPPKPAEPEAKPAPAPEAKPAPAPAKPAAKKAVKKAAKRK